MAPDIEAYRRRPRMLTDEGIHRLRILIEKARERNNWTLEYMASVMTQGNASVQKGTLSRILTRDRDPSEPVVEALASSGLLAPLTRDEIWAIATSEPMPSRVDDPAIRVSLIVRELRSLADRLLATADAQSDPYLVQQPPATRAAAAAEFAAALRRSHPDRSVLQIATHLQKCDYCHFPPDLIEGFLSEQKLLTAEQSVAFSFEENRLRSADGSLYEHAYVTRYFTESGWTDFGTRAPGVSGNPASLQQG